MGQLIKNIRTGWITTILGLVIFTASVASVFFAEGITWWDASIGLGIGLSLIFTPDTLIKKLSGLISKNQTNEN